MSRQMHFGVFMLGTGHHIAGWRMPGATDSAQSIDVVRKIAATAERGLFDLLFIGDGLNANLDLHPSYIVRLEPLTMLSAIAMATSHVGLGATMSTTYSDPYTVARGFSSLDHISGGRAAWNAVTTARGDSGGNFGRVHPVHDERYERAEEFVSVVRGLWDCWDDDAIIANRQTGQYLEKSRIHSLDHEGKHFSVKGPLTIGRSPQGQPIIIQAGGSERGQALAARTADIVFSVVQDLDIAKASYADLKARVHGLGRDPEEVFILPGVMPVVGRTDSEAFDKLNELQAFVDSDQALGMLSSRFGIDMSTYDLDGPVPDVPVSDGSQSYAKALIAKARRENLTLRHIYNLIAAARGHWVVCGSPKTIADTFEKWFVERAADGFNIMPPYFMQGFDDFVDLVVPELQARGLFRKSYTGNTLRDHLGLTRPDVGTNLYPSLEHA